MIKRADSNKMPNWADNFIGKLMASMKGEASDVPKKNKMSVKMSLKEAEDIGFIKNARKIAEGVYEDGGVVNSGSIWYLEYAEDGTQYFAKQVDEVGNIVRRAGKGKKKVAAKKKGHYATKSVINGLRQKIADAFEYDSKGLCLKKAEVRISDIDRSRKNKWNVYADVKVFSAIGDKKWVDIYDSTTKYDVSHDRIIDIQHNKTANHNYEAIENMKDQIVNLENAYAHLEKKAQAMPTTGTPSEQMTQLLEQITVMQQTITNIQTQMEEAEQQLQPTSSMDREAEDAEVMASNIYNEYSIDNTVTDRIRSYVKRIMEYGSDVVSKVITALKQMIPDESILAEMGLTMGTMAYKNKELDNIVIRNAQQMADMDKDIPVDEPVEEVKEVEEPEEEDEKGKPGKTDDEPKEPVVNFSEIKSEVWNDAAMEVLKESLDLDEAAFDFYNKIIFKMNELRSEGKVTDEQFRTMTNELEDMKDEGTFTDYLRQMIIEAPEEEAKEEAEEDEATMPIAASLNKKAEDSYIIRSLTEKYYDQPLYWSNTDGWQQKTEASVFTSQEKDEGMPLPPDGEWERIGSLNKKADEDWPEEGEVAARQDNYDREKVEKIFMDIVNNWENYRKEFTDDIGASAMDYEDAIWEYANKV